MKVPYVAIAQQNAEIKEQLLAAVDRVLSHGGFILGEEVAELETNFAAYCGTQYAVGVGSGTDAIVLTLRALGIKPGDEVITVPNSFIASTSAIILSGAIPVFVDVQNDYNLNPDLLEAAITQRTKVILPVHLTGRPADMHPILALADKHGLAVVEDAAQAVGARYHGQHVGSFGAAGCFSFHPLKNLHACGDGGIVTTNDETLYQYLRKARNNGLRNRVECEFWSTNSRLDALQAAMLRVKMKYIDNWTETRRMNAAFYREHLADVVEVPQDLSHEYAVYHTFVIQADLREELQHHLIHRGIGTNVHYPIPIHLQEAAHSFGYKVGDFPVAERQAERILSLPIYPELTDYQKRAVVTGIRGFYD
jgi:dTDP-4-amino-4,6-dideoxygalactose transaminase